MDCNKTILKLLLLLYFSKQKLMKKIFIFLVFFLLNLSAFSQDTIQFPETEQFERYFNQRAKNIIETIYTLALKNQIKAYKNDSFNSFYSPDYIPLRGACKFPNSDSIAYFKKEDIAGFNFIKSIKSTKRKETVQYNIEGIELLFRIIYGGQYGGRAQLITVKLSDVKELLSKSDYQFIIHLGRYASLDNQIKIRENPWASFQEVNFELHQFIDIDSAFMSKMAKMLYHGGAYYDIIRFMERDHPSNHPVMLKDIQTGKMINIEDIRLVYCDSMHVVCLAQNNIPEHDSIVCSYIDFKLVDSIYYDKKGQVSNFSMHIQKPILNQYGWIKGYTYPRFKIGIDIYQRVDAGSLMLWYYEDYYKWRKSQAASKN